MGTNSKCFYRTDHNDFPAIFDFTTIEGNVNHVLGPLAVTFAVISFWQCNRIVRVFNIGTGALLIIAIFIYQFRPGPFRIDMISAILLIVFSLVKGKITKKFGGGWGSLFQP